MRGMRSTIALLAVLVGLGAYIYFVTWKQDGNTAASDEKKVFQSVESGDIQELTIKAESGDRTTVRKEGETLADRRADPGGRLRVRRHRGGFRAGQPRRGAGHRRGPGDLAQYGLATPRVEVEYKAGDDKPAGKLLLGAKTPTGGNVYAMKNDEKRVFLVAEFQNASLNKSTFDLRDKSVMKSSATRSRASTSTSAARASRSRRRARSGRSSQPLVASADFGTVESLVGRVQGVQMKSIVTEQPDARRPEEVRSREARRRGHAEHGQRPRHARGRRRGR